MSSQQMNSITSVLSLVDRDVEVILDTLSEVKTDLDKGQLHQGDPIDLSKNQAIYNQLQDIQAGDRLARLLELTVGAGFYAGNLEDILELQGRRCSGGDYSWAGGTGGGRRGRARLGGCLIPTEGND